MNYKNDCIFFEDASNEGNDRKAIYFTDYFWEPRYLFVYLGAQILIIFGSPDTYL